MDCIAIKTENSLIDDSADSKARGRLFRSTGLDEKQDSKRNYPPIAKANNRFGGLTDSRLPVRSFYNRLHDGKFGSIHIGYQRLKWKPYLLKELTVSWVTSIKHDGLVNVPK